MQFLFFTAWINRKILFDLNVIALFKENEDISDVKNDIFLTFDVCLLVVV